MNCITLQIIFLQQKHLLMQSKNIYAILKNTCMYFKLRHSICGYLRKYIRKEENIYESIRTFT